ncbi:hypothetical protein [Mycolicibacterium mengxianglii]|uniref:hypothetical protein n=1 Tax=Mycolicibacterium mengxianglii TaxID=2736649 RepID=UPI0018EEDDA0|nr:hypothetical protein [Mycolicibacterium mengxianglii]
MSSRDYLENRLDTLLGAICMDELTDHEIADTIVILENVETRIREPFSKRSGGRTLRLVDDEEVAR